MARMFQEAPPSSVVPKIFEVASQPVASSRKLAEWQGPRIE
jgi:hypothetical protein